MAKKQETMAAPHSWGMNSWPSHVWPNDATKGKRFVRTYEKELLKARALVRMGRELVVMGAPFCAYMARQTDKVANFTIPCNRPEHLSKRHNGAAKEEARP